MRVKLWLVWLLVTWFGVAFHVQAAPVITLELNGNQRYQLRNFAYSIGRTFNGTTLLGEPQEQTLYISLVIIGAPDAQLVNWISGNTNASGKIVYQDEQTKRELIFYHATISEIEAASSLADQDPGTDIFVGFSCRDVVINGMPLQLEGQSK